ncbi:MAG: hypothetical protein ACK2UW_05010 [Anaerolineales bacterium]|jgi:uncharacterized phage infection (PIP) family protein YhgE
MAISSGINKVVGLVFMVLAGAGMLLSLFGIVQVWQLQTDLSARLVESLDLTVNTLNATNVGLDHVSDSLESTAASLTILQRTSDTSVKTIDEALLLLDTADDVINTQLSETIGAVQDSLATAEQGASLIDDYLRLLSRIPFISSVTYEPTVPLGQSIADISESLNDIPETLASTGTQLESTRSNLMDFQERFPELSEQLQAIEGNLLAMQDVIATYHRSLERVIEVVENAREKAPNGLRTIAWVLTALLFFLAFALTGPLLHGWQLFQQNQAAKTDSVQEA